ncbi:MAG: hypothetical protein WEC59_04820, partial [Salibacteraceae bacterium]
NGDSILDLGVLGIKVLTPSADLQIGSHVVASGTPFEGVRYFGFNVFQDGTDLRYLNNDHADVYGAGNGFSGLFHWPTNAAGAVLPSNSASAIRLQDSSVSVFGQASDSLFMVAGHVIIDSLSIANAYSFPKTDGSANQLLHTDGAGNLTWQDNSAIGNGIADILTNDSNALGRGIYDVGKLGIGTNTLGTNDFYLNGLGYVNLPTNNTYFTIDNYGGGLSVRNTNNNHMLRLRPNTGGPLYQTQLQMVNNGNTLDIILDDTPASSNIQASTDLTLHAGGTTGTLHIDAGGNVGIGTTTPTTELHVIQSGDAEARLESTGSSDAILTLANSTNTWDIRNFAGELRVVNGGNDQLTIETNGNVGIGTVNPSSTLDVVGDVEIPSANDYTYSTAQTRYASVSAAGFTPLQGVSGLATIQSIEIGGFVSGNARWVAGGTNGSSATLYAPIQLPDGATVTEVTFYIYDNDGTYGVEGSLRRHTLGGTIVSVLGSTPTSGNTATPGTTSLTESTILNAVIDNSSYSYFLRFSTYQNNNDLRIYGARVTYEVSKTD